VVDSFRSTLDPLAQIQERLQEREIRVSEREQEFDRALMRYMSDSRRQVIPVDDDTMDA